MKRLIALVAAAAAASALAQGAPPPPSNTPTQGFFRPSDLAWPAQPVIATQPGAPGVQPPLYALPDPIAAAAIQTIEQIRADEAMRIEEIQMDHLERENERASQDLPFLSLGGGRYR
jgi:hypothetical protein